MLLVDVHRSVHRSHVLDGNRPVKAGECSSDLGPPEQCRCARKRHGIVRWEIPQVVFEHREVEHVDQGAGGVAGDDIDVTVRQRLVHQ